MSEVGFVVGNGQAHGWAAYKSILFYENREQIEISLLYRNTETLYSKY
jgi:hypothetical protein